MSDQPNDERSPLNASIQLLLPAAALLVAFPAIACDDDDDDDGLNGGTTPTTVAGTPDGNDVSDDVEERFNKLRDRFESASEETQDELANAWDLVQETYDEWVAAADDQQDDLAETFDRLADEIEDALDDDDGAASSPTPGSSPTAGS